MDHGMGDWHTGCGWSVRKGLNYDGWWRIREGALFAY